MKYWIVKIGVPDTWVADGFSLGNKRGQEMIEAEPGHATSRGVSFVVLKSPSKSSIVNLQIGKTKPMD